MGDWISGRKILITAAGQGIGRASAIAFSQAGADVLATDINEAALQALTAETGIATRRMNVLDDTDVNAVVAETGPFDALFNCAGYVHGGTVLEMSDKDLDFAFDLNVRSMVRTTTIESESTQRFGMVSSVMVVPNRKFSVKPSALALAISCWSASSSNWPESSQGMAANPDSCQPKKKQPR